jgi:outer membrane cobalamin receptor
MFLRKTFLLMLLLLSSARLGHAQAFGTVRGNVVDQQQGAILDATVTINARASAYMRSTKTDGAGMFTIPAVPADTYTIEIEREGFQKISQTLNVAIGSAPMLNFTMAVAGVTSEVEVTTEFQPTNPEASSPPVTVDETEISHAPGADRASSIAFITDFVPGAFLLHDHLHVRGGHQVSWLVDGVPVPNTNLSSNVGRQIDPKDIENVEVSTGGYQAKYGDRTYGMVNIVPRSGSEFGTREAQLTMGYGSFNQSNNQLSFGGHGERFAYYSSIGGNRTDLGLEPPEKEIIHNNANGLTGFTSLNFDLRPSDQMRLTASVRRDHYWVPNTAADQAFGVRDVNRERDSFATISWVHTFNPETLLTVSPFYHYNHAQYDGGLNDPLITTDRRTSQYVGGQAIIGYVHEKHNMSAGVNAFHQSDNREFGLFEQSTRLSASEDQKLGGNLWTSFLDEQYKPWRVLTLNAGLRLTHYAGTNTENAVNPRIGATIEVPRLRWVLRSFFGTYYQAPPLSALSGPVLDFAVKEGFGFLPLKGERDEQNEFGLTIPIKGWTLSFARFRTNAENFSDHEVLGNSNITLPLSIQTVHSRGTEVRLTAPEYKRVHYHLAYSNMIVQGRGAITAGMTDFAAPEKGYFFIDHDQRQTLSTGGEIRLPRRAWINANIVAGSGFLDGDGPEHLPSHASLDIAAGKALGENLEATLTALNLTDTRFLLGRDSSFAGTHYNDPRQLTVQVRYRFHF